MQNINIHGASSSSPLTESERNQYKQEIYRLRYEKESLSLELQKRQQEQQEIELAARGLTERLRIAGTHQRDILSALENTMQKPAQVLDTNDRKRRLLAETSDQLCLFDVPTDETLTTNALLALDLELVEQLESSLMFWEDIFTEKWLLKLDHERETNIEMGSKDSENSESFKNVVTKEEAETGNLKSVQVGVNDGFWEQFLTENPGGSMPENDRRGFEQYGKFWWNMRSVNSVAETT